MDLFIPLFVAVPLGAAFLIAIIGGFLKGFGKIFIRIEKYSEN